MIPRTALAMAWLLPFAGFFLSASQSCDGCAAVGRLKYPITIAEESALILWDAATKTQHFIRRATFDTKAEDFGFLVPTPTQPKLEQAKDATFDTVETWTRAKRTTQFKFNPFFCMMCPMGCGIGSSSKSEKDKAGDVRILDAQRVGDFDAVVLEADDANALVEWLKKQGYPSTPELTSWLGPYVAKSWKITAFKIARGAVAQPGIATRPVRMTFTTEIPFFPYREPEEPKAKEVEKTKEDPKDSQPQRNRRVLRVLFVGDKRMDGSVGNKQAWPPFHGSPQFADKLTADERQALLKETGLQDKDLPPTAWLTVFEDPSSPRAGRDEVYFAPSPEQQPLLHRENIGTIWIPIDAIILSVVLVLGTVVFIYSQRKRRLPA